jgi:hypothetical protein
MDKISNQNPELKQPNRQLIAEMILVIAIIITSAVAALFYFDILPYKSFSKNIKKLVATTPSPTNSSQNIFKYDAAKAKTLLTKYIKDTLKPELLPTEIEVKQGLTIDGRIEDVKKEFGSSFNALGATISANFHYVENSNTANEYTIFIQPNNVAPIETSASTANTLLSSYFKTPYIASNCQAKENVSYCQNFQTTAEGKRGYGILTGNDRGNTVSIIFTCFISKESKEYMSFKSCLTL